MGQRSQIYIRIKEKNKNYLVASYFQWNWGWHMISRTRSLLEYINDNIDYIAWQNHRISLRRFAEINFSNKNIVLSSNINQQFVQYCDNNENYVDFIFYGQDNNDGKLFIDVDADKKTVKYCLTDCDAQKPLSAKQYMIFDEEDDWAKNYNIEDLEIINDNFKYIQTVKLMTTEELNEFINADYVDKPKNTPVRITKMVDIIIPVNDKRLRPYAKVEVTDGTLTKVIAIKEDKRGTQYVDFNGNRYEVKNVSDNYYYPIFQIKE